MDERFIRNLGALTGEECEMLRNKKVFIAGCGGLGGYLAEYLLRVGVGEIAVADFDRFERSNFNRQLLCTGENIGLAKAEAAEKRAADIAPDTVFRGHVCRLDENSLPELLYGCDAVLDALDSAVSRRLVKAECDRQAIPFFFGAVSGWVAQAAFSPPGDGLTEILYSEGYTSEDRGILSFTPALGAALEASLCVRYLCGRPVEPGWLYSFDLQQMDLAALRF